jgi:tRNA A37 threonylcarbamoyladenosine biosynthesis protein TsaE
MKFDVRNINELAHVARFIKTNYFDESVHIFFNGSVGAGKTSLASLLVSNFKHVDLTSSSYSLVNIFAGCPFVIHCDFYRAQWSSEFFELEIYPIITGYHFLFLEWVKPQVLESSITTLSVKIDVCSFDSRTIEVTRLS